ncbi:MAG: carcinine hydrolase/isopenicillin-N N-acyltransferase family protein, partial [Bacteroidota bacterium]
LTYNQDLPFFLHGINKPVVLRSQNEIVFTLPGMLALSGVSKSIAVSCNSLPMLQMNEVGLPLSFAIRQLLSQNSLEYAQTFLEAIPLAIPQNFLVAAPEGIMGFEVSQNTVSPYSAEHASYLYHTNFPVLNQDYKYAKYQAPTCQRYKAIETFMKEKDETFELSTQQLIDLFSTNPLNNDETFLRFTVSYSNQSKEFPSVQFINPKQNNTSTLLTF